MKDRPRHCTRIRFFLVVPGLLSGFAACQPFDVQLETPEPIKVDVTMRVDVYQYGGLTEEEKVELSSYKDVIERQRNRMAEIQTLKNSRLIGENHLGLLSIRNLPAGDYGQYVKETVDAENVDRVFLMTRRSDKRGEGLAETEKLEWKERTEKSFNGEWIETEGEEPETYRWVRKGGS